MPKNFNVGRARPWTVVFYGTQRELFSILHTYDCRINKYAFIKHDKCHYLEDLIEGTKVIHKKGELEKEHFHVLVDFFNGHTFSSVKRIFTTENDKPRVEKITDRVAQYRYLTHKDNPEKYQYDESAIISNDINYYEKLCLEGDKVDNDNKAECIIMDILKGVSPRIMLSRYGREYVINYQKYQDFAGEIRLSNVNDILNEKHGAVRLEEIDDEQLEIPFE